MRLVTKLASLGHAARDQAGIKVRQPLSEAAFAVSKPGEAQLLENYADLLMDELNVKSVRLLGSAGEAVSYSLKPLPRQLGQKYKGLFPKVSQAIGELDASQAGPSVLAGEAVKVTVEGITLEIQPDEVEVSSIAQAGFAVASEGGYLAALKTGLTSALRQEGLAREFVRRAQELRKQAGLEIADRIRLYITATPGVLEAIQAHRDYVAGETLALEIIEGEAPGGVAASEAWFDGQWVKVGIEKVE
jgi:isoleucyl-tRNA synthetase